MATFIQAVAQYGPPLKWLPRVRLDAMAIRLADIVGVRLDAMAIRLADVAGVRLHVMTIRLTDVAGVRQGKATRARRDLPATVRHGPRREAAVAPVGSGPFMPAMRPAGAPTVDRAAAGAT